jgi:hypothetical protein
MLPSRESLSSEADSIISPPSPRQPDEAPAEDGKVAVKVGRPVENRKERRVRLIGE